MMNGAGSAKTEWKVSPGCSCELCKRQRDAELNELLGRMIKPNALPPHYELMGLPDLPKISLPPIPPLPKVDWEKPSQFTPPRRTIATDEITARISSAITRLDAIRSELGALKRDLA